VGNLIAFELRSDSVGESDGSFGKVGIEPKRLKKAGWPRYLSVLCWCQHS
jgi:hypothetical protein